MAVRELAQRNQNGLIVRLLWDSIRDCVILRYRDIQVETSSRPRCRRRTHWPRSSIRTSTARKARRIAVVTVDSLYLNGAFRAGRSRLPFLSDEIAS